MHEPMGGEGVCTVHWSVCGVTLSVGYAAGGSLDAGWMDMDVYCRIGSGAMVASCHSSYI